MSLAIQYMKLEHPLIEMVKRKCVFSRFANKDLFCWVPRHLDIRGDEKADSAARSALEFNRAKVGVSYTDFKHCHPIYSSSWQDD